MRILMIAPYPLPEEPVHGGVETVSYNLIEGFRQIPEAEVLVISGHQKEDREIRLSDNVTVRFVKYESKRRKIELKRHLKPLIRELNETWAPDIIHIQGNGSALLYYDPVYQDKLVITQHGILQNEIKYSKGLRERLNKLIAIHIENSKKKYFKNWVFISEYNRNLFCGLKDKNALLAYNPVNPVYFAETGPRDTTGDKTKLLFVGRLIPLKGVNVLLEALNSRELSEKVELHIVGGADTEDYLKSLEDYVKINGLEKTVIFHGWKNSNDIIKIERDCDALILPSYQENLPCVIAEAMSMGKIVLASSVGGVGEMVDEGSTGFMFKAGDISGLRKAILKLIALDEKQKRDMSEQASLKAKRFYEPSEVARQHLDFYRSIASYRKQ